MKKKLIYLVLFLLLGVGLIIGMSRINKKKVDLGQRNTTKSSSTENEIFQTEEPKIEQEYKKKYENGIIIKGKLWTKESDNSSLENFENNGLNNQDNKASGGEAATPEKE